MLSGKKASRRHQTREYRRLLRPQKDLRAFFGPLAVTIGVLSLVALAVGGAFTTGRHGVMPQYETSAVGSPSAGDNYLLLNSEETYWKLASSMGGFPIKHFYKGGVSLRPGTDGQMLRRVEDGVGAGGGAVYGAGLETGDLAYRKQTWLSRRIARIKDYFNIKAGPAGSQGDLQGTQLAAGAADHAGKRLIMKKIRSLQEEVQAAAARRVPPYQVMPGIVVRHSLPAVR